jgi:hypothetical protein
MSCSKVGYLVLLVSEKCVFRRSMHVFNMYVRICVCESMYVSTAGLLVCSQDVRRCMYVCV